MKNRVIVGFIPLAKKNRMKVGKGRLFHEPRAADQVKKLPLFLKQLKPIPPGVAAAVYLGVNLEAETMIIEVEEFGRYDLPKHSDLDGILTSVLDALEDAGIVENDSRVVQIRAQFL